MWSAYDDVIFASCVRAIQINIIGYVRDLIGQLNGFEPGELRYQMLVARPGFVLETNGIMHFYYQHANTIHFQADLSRPITLN